MALKGTLKDFGIADILQLIGQQQKTGVLRVTNKREEVVVAFRDGNIVRAEAEHRARKELLGAMLRAAELVTQQQLELALETQKRTLQRLGDVLVANGAIRAEKLRDIMQLQTSETLYRLFGWKSGTYEFEQTEVDADLVITPLRAETVLMEGFRRVDEWPEVRKRISSLQVTFEKLKELPSQKKPADDGLALSLGDAFGQTGEKSASPSDSDSIGESEHIVFQKIAPGRSAARVIELACLGEFETAKALSNLVAQGYLKVLSPSSRGGRDFEDGRAGGALGAVARVAIMLMVALAVLLVGSQIRVGALGFGSASSGRSTDLAAQRFFSRQQMSRIASAISVYQLEQGALPESLQELVQSGLIEEDDVRFPWRDTYYYRRSSTGTFVLLPPLR